MNHEIAAHYVPPQSRLTRADARRPNETEDGETDRFRQSDLPAWFAAVVILLSVLAGGYLLWAKVSSAWPF
jgi:hypothetical protein